MSAESETNGGASSLSADTVEGIHSSAACYRQGSLSSQRDSTVLVIYTGGTIGMVNLNGSYQPLANCMISKLRSLPIFNSAAIQQQGSKEENEDSFLVLQSSAASPRRVAYKIIEFDPLLDSSNMAISDWIKIAECIKENYEEYDGFVVLHGTDTMAYTASALSFMLENLGKPVILTGSQIPIYESRSDGRNNFLDSLIIAGTCAIPEVVMICFFERVYRGNRCIKSDAESFSAFASPNMSPLVQLQVKIKVDYSSIFRQGSEDKFCISTNMCPNVGLLRLFPGITIQTVRAFLHPPVQGVVLQTYGAGNAPNNRPDLLSLFKEAYNWGVIIVNISQCTKGNVGASYATGAEVLKVKDALYPCLMSAAAKANDIPALEKLRVTNFNFLLADLLNQFAPPLNMVHYLLNHGVSVHARDCRRETPLYDAVSRGHLDIIRVLTQTGASLHLSVVDMAVKMC
ncbi:hypothetical protein EGW08_012885, partial [Elysia chlorotica]